MRLGAEAKVKAQITRRVVAGALTRKVSNVDEEDVRPAVAVLVQDGHTRTCFFNDVTFALDASIDVANVIPAFAVTSMNHAGGA